MTGQRGALAVFRLPLAGFGNAFIRPINAINSADTLVKISRSLADPTELAGDPILAKLVVWGADRDAALLRARRALAETVLLGVRTNLDFLQTVTSHPVFTSGNATTRWIDQALAELTEPKTPSAPVLALAAVAEHLTSGAASSRRAQGTVPGGDPYSPWEQLTGFRIGGTR